MFLIWAQDHPEVSLVYFAMAVIYKCEVSLCYYYAECCDTECQVIDPAAYYKACFITTVNYICKREHPVVYLATTVIYKCKKC